MTLSQVECRNLPGPILNFLSWGSLVLSLQWRSNSQTASSFQLLCHVTEVGDNYISSSCKELFTLCVNSCESRHMYLWKVK